MPTISVSITETLRKEMTALDEINWSAVARRAFEREVEEQRLFQALRRKLAPEEERQLEVMRTIIKKSKFTEKDAKELGDQIDAAVSVSVRDDLRRRRERASRDTHKSGRTSRAPLQGRSVRARKIAR